MTELPPEVTDDGENPTVVPVGRPEAVNPTVWGLPEMVAVLMVLVAEEPDHGRARGRRGAHGEVTRWRGRGPGLEQGYAVGPVHGGGERPGEALGGRGGEILIAGLDRHRAGAGCRHQGLGGVAGRGDRDGLG